MFMIIWIEICLQNGVAYFPAEGKGSRGRFNT